MAGHQPAVRLQPMGMMNTEQDCIATRKQGGPAKARGPARNRKRGPTLLLPGAVALLLTPAQIPAEIQPATTDILISRPAVPESLRREAHAAVDRSCKWLARMQNEAGHWSNPEFPALTALPVWGLCLAGRQDTEPVHAGTRYILSCVREDGSIWQEPGERRKGGGLSNYNTALCMVALHIADPDKFSPHVLNARKYLAQTQHRKPDKFRGGMGYDAGTGRTYADLSNSYMSYEAMKLSGDLRKVEDENRSADLDWNAARAFVESLQNDDGGFIYKPGHSMAGADTNETGEITFRSYGSMTYAGLLSLIYADVGKSDPRVQSALDWTVKHWTLEKNPGMGQEGIYYFYNVLTKALAVCGRETLTQPDGTKISWRSELIRKLLNLQKIDPSDGSGYWVNQASRWMEADPVLVTSYAQIALLVALGDQ